MAGQDGMRLDELAQRAGVATTTVRLYKTKGLLPPPRLVGRTGYYDDSHLARLRLIAKLQHEGFSLAGIGRVLETWQDGRDITDLVGVERQLDALLAGRDAIVLDAAELAGRFPAGGLTPELVQRALALGVVEPTDDGRFRVPDPRFIETGAALVRLGLPADVVLDEWEQLVSQTDEIAARFIGLFEKHLLPRRWKRLGPSELAGVAGTLRGLQEIAPEVVAAALDASIARLGAQRLAELAPAKLKPRRPTR